jgi:uncharacterized cupin superfamily protein
MKCVANLLDENLNYESWRQGDSYAGSSAPLAKEWGAERLGFHVERLSPGKFSCPYHSHRKEEELFIALNGSATIRQDGEFFRVHKGDVFFFKSGVAHQMFNHTSEPFLFFALSNTDPDEVCQYPDSRKILSVKDKTISQDGQIVSDYWKDEEDPKRFWPDKILKPTSGGL